MQLASFHRFFSRFSYSAKAKFIIITSIAVSLSVALFLFKVQSSLIHILQRQSIASNYFKTLQIELLPPFYLLFSIDKAEDDRLLERTLKKLHSKTNEMDVFFKLKQKEKEKLYSIQNSADQITKQQFNNINIFLTESNILLTEASELIGRQLEINLGVDPTTFVLAQISYQTLLQQQRLLILSQAFKFNRKFLNNRIIEESHHAAQRLIKAIQALNDESVKLHLLNSINSFLKTLQEFKNTFIRKKNKWNENKKEDNQNLLYYFLIRQAKLLNISVSDALTTLLDNYRTTLQRQQYIGIGCLLMGIAIVAVMYSSRVMRSPLSEIQKVAKQLIRGRLSERCRLHSKDEVGLISKDFNQLSTHIENTIGNTLHISQQLLSILDAITLSAKKFEQKTTSQEQSISHIALYTGEIAKMDQQVMGSLQQAQQLAFSTKVFAEEEQDHIAEMEEVMTLILNSAEQIVRTLKGLDEKVQDIIEIIIKIVTVADQANLLAVNTALMASNTSAQPVGFGIIAEKIKELASRTADVTLQTEESAQAILKGIRTATAQVEVLSGDVIKHREVVISVIDRFKQLINLTETQIGSFEALLQKIHSQELTTSQIHETITRLSQSAKITTQSVRYLYNQIQSIRSASEDLQAVLFRYLSTSSSNL